MAIDQRRSRVLQNEIHHPLADDPVRRRFPRHINAIEPLIKRSERPSATAIGQTLRRFLLVDRKHHISARYRLIQQIRQKLNVIRQ